MNVNVLVPLIATIAYIPLFVILLSNRPWQRRHRLFLLFLIPAMLWSLSGFFLRSNLFAPHILAKIIPIATIWMLVQLHYFISSFYRSEHTRIPLAYIFLIVTIVLTGLDFIPQSIEVTATGTVIVHYGIWLIAIGLLFLFTLGVQNVYSLLQRYRISSDASERNQIAYLLAAIGVLVVFLLGSFTPRGGEYPVPHIGNFVTACVLTYAVVTHRLLDVRVIFRQALIYVVLYGGSIGMVVLFFWLAQRFVGFELNFASLALAIGFGIPAVLLFVHKVRGLWQKKVEEAFIGARYSYRRQLTQFITKIHDVPTLEQLGSEFISLLAQSLDCRRACLLLPEAGNEGFSVRFTYPPVEDNPMGELKLRPDSPVVTWLEHESTMLPERNLDIFPEFQSISFLNSNLYGRKREKKSDWQG